MPGGQLARIEEAQHLVEVAAGAHRIHDHRLDLLVGPDDEHGAHRGVVHGGAFAADRSGVDHVVELRDGEICVADQRIVDGVPLRLLDVLDPGLVIAHGIDAESDDLGVPLVELGLETGHVAELSGANGREVLRMREEDCPLVADPFVEVDLPLRGLSGEIRRLVSYAYGHVRLLFRSWGPRPSCVFGMRDCNAARGPTPTPSELPRSRSHLRPRRLTRRYATSRGRATIMPVCVGTRARYVASSSSRMTAFWVVDACSNLSTPPSSL